MTYISASEHYREMGVACLQHFSSAKCHGKHHSHFLVRYRLTNILIFCPHFFQLSILYIFRHHLFDRDPGNLSLWALLSRLVPQYCPNNANVSTLKIFLNNLKKELQKSYSVIVYSDLFQHIYCIHRAQAAQCETI